MIRKSCTHSQDVSPSFLVEVLSAKVSFVDLLCFLYLLLGDHTSREVALQDVLQPEEYSTREFTPSTLKIRLDNSRIRRILKMVGDLKEREIKKITI